MVLSVTLHLPPLSSQPTTHTPQLVSVSAPCRRLIDDVVVDHQQTLECVGRPPRQATAQPPASALERCLPEAVVELTARSRIEQVAAEQNVPARRSVVQRRRALREHDETAQKLVLHADASAQPHQAQRWPPRPRRLRLGVDAACCVGRQAREKGVHHVHAAARGSDSLSCWCCLLPTAANTTGTTGATGATNEAAGAAAAATTAAATATTGTATITAITCSPPPSKHGGLPACPARRRWIGSRLPRGARSPSTAPARRCRIARRNSKPSSGTCSDVPDPSWGTPPGSAARSRRGCGAQRA
mmetsp:Transcript_13222/g.30128  ORF Transcript_13222/g.30128 Transcript_13222/m.30128 type:complete len:301 (+) Transcript_13222:76-978(+)